MTACGAIGLFLKNSIFIPHSITRGHANSPLTALHAVLVGVVLGAVNGG
jgi:hypothetical protein